MKETRDEISRYLNTIPADHVRMLFRIMCNMLCSNMDFAVILDQDAEELMESIGQETGKSPDSRILYLLEKSISGTRSALLTEVNNYYSDEKVTKKNAVRIMSEVLSDDLLFEGMCTAAYTFNNDHLRKLCDIFGCSGRLEELERDRVYQARKKYVSVLCDYTEAARNLYGVIHVRDMLELIRHYEKSFPDGGQFLKETGDYSETLYYTPENLCVETLDQIIGNAIPGIVTTIDGLMLHACFAKECDAEVHKIGEFFAKNGAELGDDQIDEYMDVVGDTSYRQLYAEAMEKDRYMPDKREFLRYMDSAYCEETGAEKVLKNYLLLKYGEALNERARTEEVSRQELADGLVHELRNMASDHGLPDERLEPGEIVQEAINIMQSYGIYFRGTEDINAFLQKYMPVINQTRLWSNAGHTAEELRREGPHRSGKRFSGPPKIVAGSSHAAEMLLASADTIRSMGFDIDPEYGADSLPVIDFPRGINGPETIRMQKVYPNDPCPCGSGKKYKKCCGRNRG